MERLVVSICFCITLSGCISYEPLPPNRPITEDEFKRRVKSHAGKTPKEQQKRPALIRESFGFDWPDTGYDSPFPFGGDNGD
jgi:hypothetical protein